MMVSYIFFLCFISQNVFGEDLHDSKNLQSILKEFETMKKLLKENSEKLVEIDYLKERTLALEKQNKQLYQRIEKLESRCVEKTEEDEVRTENSGTLVHSTSTHQIAFKPESTKEVSRRQTLSKSKTNYLGQRNLGRRSLQPHVAFTVGVSADNLHNLGDHQTIIFDRVITNIGNAYQKYTGIFTVPVKGAYVITLTMTVEPDKVQWLDLVVDGVIINVITAGIGNTNNYASSTKQWILDLTTGSQVWVRKAGPTYYKDLHGSMNTIMSGFLLFQT